MSAVLLVEDQENVRRGLRGLLIDKGLKVIEAVSHTDAIEIFQRSPGVISGLITDCRLVNDSDENDVSGLEVGRAIRRHNPKLPIYLNSAFDCQEMIKTNNPFDFVYRKSSPDTSLDIAQNLSTVIKAVTDFDKSRFDNIPDLLLFIKEKYTITDDDFLRLVSMTPISAKMQIALSMSHELQEGGEWEDVMDSSSQLILLSSNMDFDGADKIKRDFSIVHKKTSNTHIVEVFGIPAIYAYGDTLKEAQQGLVASLASYSNELSIDGDSKNIDVADSLIRLRAFLNEVI